MDLTQLALRSITGNKFRSWAVILCAMLLSGSALFTSVVMGGAERSLELARNRLGADIVVVPEGSSEKIESALLMGTPTRAWMPASNLKKIAEVPGVDVASPQLYLSTLSNASCCSVPSMFMVAYDPKTDFTIEPWLIEKIGDGLHLGEAVGGTYIFTPEGEQNIQLYGYFITLIANMEATGTGLDQSMFLTFETANDIARLSTSLALEPLIIPEDSISAVMVKVEPGRYITEVAVQILKDVPGVTPIESPYMFQSYRQQIGTLLSAVSAVMVSSLALSVLLVGFIFSMAVHERRRELGVLRALGATDVYVFKSIVLEALLLALSGGLLGTILSALIVYLFHKLIINTIGFPYVLPSIPMLVVNLLAGLGIALLFVVTAALFPAFRISRQEPAIAMRE